MLRRDFVCAYKQVGTFTVIVDGEGKPILKVGGNVAAYVCTPDGEVIHAVAGNVDGATLRREAEWALDLYHRAREEARGDREKMREAVAKAHGEKEKTSNTVLLGTALTTFEPVIVNGTAVQDLSVLTNGTAMTEYRLAIQSNTSTLLWKGEPVAQDPLKCGFGLNGGTTVFVRPSVRAQAVEALSLSCLVSLGNSGTVHAYLAENAMKPLPEIYRHVWESILGERVSDQPVSVVKMQEYHRSFRERLGTIRLKIKE